MKILGIDFGEAKIGLALCEGEIAEPIGVIPFHNWKVMIKDICRKEKIDKIVLGITNGEMGKKIEHFGQTVIEETGLPVEYWDETLTSNEAVTKMIEAGKTKKRRREDEHSVAAAIILQSYIESKQYG